MKRILILFYLLIFLYSNVHAAKKKILIIQSYSKELKWTSQCEKGIENALGTGYEIKVFFMNTKKIPESLFPKKAKEAIKLYKDIKPDLVLVGDDNALRLLAPVFSNIKTPVVFFGINNNPRIYFKNSVKIPDNVTGVLERLPVFPWIRHLKEIIPDMKSVLVMMDSSATSEAIVNQTFQNNNSVTVSGIKVSYKISKMWSQWKEIIKSADRYSLVLLVTFHALKDEKGNMVDYREVIKWTSKNTPVPLFGHQDYTVGSDGVAGAMVVQGFEHGKLAGKLAVEILAKNKKPNALFPVRDHEGKFYFSKKQIKKYKLKVPERILKKTEFKD